jgi:hypothetical protein
MESKRWSLYYNNMLTRQINILVKNDFVIPDVYTKGNLEEAEEALWIGATIQQSVKTRRANDEVRKISELKDSEINRIQSMYNEKLTKLLDDIKSITTEKDRVSTEYSEGLKEARGKEREVVTREWEEKQRLLRKDHEVLQSRFEALEARRRALEESRAKDIQDATKRTEELMEKLVASKADQLVKMEAAYMKLNETILKQSEEISKLSGNLSKRSANVKTKGSDYEEEFGEKLKRNYGLCRGFQIKDTRLGMGHEMDFSMELEGQVLMWELKNYGNIVPKAEVEKFLRDLKENPQAKIGVMISRSTDIHGKAQSGHLLTEFDNDKMMIYINKFEEFCGEDENRVFQMLMSLFKIWWQYHREENNTFDRVDIVRELEKAIEDISKRRTDWRRHKAHLDEIGRWTADLLDESEGRLDRILKKARNAEDVTVDRPFVIPEGVFRDSGEEKELTWMKSIMKVCEAGGEIEVRELVELLGAHHKLSKDTIRSNVMSIIKDSAVIKKGVVKYIKGISKFVPECLINTKPANM